MATTAPAFAQASGQLLVTDFVATYAPDQPEQVLLSATVTGFDASYQLTVTVLDGGFDSVESATAASASNAGATASHTLVFTSTLQTSIARALAAPELAADLVATSLTAQLTRAEADRIAEVDGWLEAFAAATDRRTSLEKGAGAAGGIGYALLVLGASREPGIELVASAVSLADRARALIAIAHPDHREALEREAHEAGVLGAGSRPADGAPTGRRTRATAPSG